MIHTEVIYRPQVGSTWINANDYIFNKDFLSFLKMLGEHLDFNKRNDEFMAQFSTKKPYDKNKYFVIRKSDFYFIACKPTKKGAKRYHREDTILIDTSEYFQS